MASSSNGQSHSANPTANPTASPTANSAANHSANPTANHSASSAANPQTGHHAVAASVNRACSLSESNVSPTSDSKPGFGANSFEVPQTPSVFALLLRRPGFVLSVLVLAFWVIAAVAPQLLSSANPTETLRNSQDAVAIEVPPSAEFVFGTDRLGRSVYSRVVYGARPILLAAPLAAAIAAGLGALLGLSTGYFRGWFDEIIGRTIDGLLAIPAVLLAIVVVFTFGKSTTVVILTVAVLFIAPITRTVRAAALKETDQDYVTAAKLRGEGWFYIITREILPNVKSIVLVELTVRLGYAVFLLATLAFLGVTAKDVTAPDWGVDVAQNYNLMNSGVWWPTIIPALAIASLVIAVNTIANAIEEVAK